jgi:methyltransferase-like protein
MTEPNPLQDAYEAVPYRGGALPETHPGHLAALGLIFGMKPAPAERCRVLEIACAAGTNLLPMAAVLPQSTFVGIDLSRIHIAAAEQAAHAAGLGNVALYAVDLLDFHAEPRSFDYIIAHGLFSWVPDPVKQGILRLCGEALADHGIAMISYNCYPGWSHRAALCDLIRLRLSGLEGFDARTRAAWETLDMLDSAMAKLKSPHAAMTSDIIRSMRRKNPNVFYHDDIGRINDPCYFLQFVEWAAEHGLQYLSDASLSSMLYENLPAGTRSAIEALRLDHLQTEQYMDFLRNRMFRSTLLCRGEVALKRQIDRDALAGLRFRSMMTAQNPIDLRASEPAQFMSRHKLGVTAHEALPKAFLAYLSAQSPRFVPFGETLARAESDAAVTDHAGSLLDLALNLLAKDLLEVSAFGVEIPTEIPSLPAAMPLARYQAAQAPAAVNLVHERRPLSSEERAILQTLDGTRLREEFDPQTLERLRKMAFILPAHS